MTDPYRPEDDPAVQALAELGDDEARALELTLIEPTDNSPKDTDPE